MSKIMLIDDDVDLVDMYRLVLVNRGHEVVSAYSAAEARRLLQAQTVDLVVMDVMMESMTAGFELARDVQQMHPGLPALMLSGVHEATGVPFRFTPDETWLPVLKFLDKPVAPSALADEIERTLTK